MKHLGSQHPFIGIFWRYCVSNHIGYQTEVNCNFSTQPAVKQQGEQNSRMMFIIYMYDLVLCDICEAGYFSWLSSSRKVTERLREGLKKHNGIFHESPPTQPS